VIFVVGQDITLSIFKNFFVLG